MIAKRLQAILSRHADSVVDGLDSFPCFHKYGIMESDDAVRKLAALAQSSRLMIFRALVQAGPAGLYAGEIGMRLGLTPATLSFHLKELSQVGLIHARQQGRFIYYAPDFSAMNGLLDYLTENCCRGDAPQCSPTE